MEYTKGEWTHYNGSIWSKSPDIDKSQRTNMICSISERWKMPENEKIANARLIAAAPEMYEALKEARQWILAPEERGEKDVRTIILKMGEALSKADML
jgi:hypothetical protein